MMSYYSKLSFSILALACALTMSACSSSEKAPKAKEYTKYDMDGQYWQRLEAQSALYLRGPKAQEQLHRDIANCVVEVREITHLNKLRHITPSHNRTLSGIWDSPERHGPMYAEHKDFNNFETCMHTNGWERVAFVPYDVQDNAHKVYVDTMTGNAKPQKRTFDKASHSKKTSAKPTGTLND